MTAVSDVIAPVDGTEKPRDENMSSRLSMSLSVFIGGFCVVSNASKTSGNVPRGLLLPVKVVVSRASG